MPEQVSGAGRESFGSRLGAAMAARGPLCVGIDPHPPRRMIARSIEQTQHLLNRGHYLLMIEGSEQLVRWGQEVLGHYSISKIY